MIDKIRRDFVCVSSRIVPSSKLEIGPALEIFWFMIIGFFNIELLFCLYQKDDIISINMVCNDVSFSIFWDPRGGCSVRSYFQLMEAMKEEFVVSKRFCACQALCSLIFLRGSFIFCKNMLLIFHVVEASPWCWCLVSTISLSLSLISLEVANETPCQYVYYCSRCYRSRRLYIHAVKKQSFEASFSLLIPCVA